MRTTKIFFISFVIAILSLLFVSYNSLHQDQSGVENTQAETVESRSSDSQEHDSPDETTSLEPSSFLESESYPETDKSSSEDYTTESHISERNIDYVELTNLSNSMEPAIYREGDTYQTIKITNVEVSQQQVDGRWENVKVKVKFVGELRLKGTLCFSEQGITSFVISDKSYDIAPGVIVDLPDYNGIHPTSVNIENDLIRNLLPDPEGDFKKEAEIAFSEYDLVYGRYSSMNAMGIPVEIILDDESLSAEEENI